MTPCKYLARTTMTIALFAMAYVSFGTAFAEIAADVAAPTHQLAPASGLAVELALDMEGYGAEKSGLPQLHYGTYPSQIFWLLVSFLAMYALFSAKILPDISEVLERRRETITSDLETADTLRGEAETVQAEYEKAIDDARTQAAIVMADMKTQMRKDADAEYAAFKNRSIEDIRRLEQKAEETKLRLLSEMKTVSAEVTAEIVKKVSSIDTDVKEAENTIETLMGKKAKAA